MNEKNSVSIKGLIFREFFLGRKTYISVLIVSVVSMALFMLCLLSIKIGNLSLMEDVEDMSQMLYNMAVCMSAFVFTAFSFGIIDGISADFRTKWSGYMRATPVKTEKYIGIKFGIIACFIALSVVLSTICSAMISALNGVTLTADYFSVIMCIITLCTFFCVYYIAFCYLFGDNSKATTVFSTTIISIILCGLFLIIKYGENLSPEDDLFKIIILDKTRVIAPFSPLIIIATLILGYILCIKFSKRRER